jgi:shikimate kinase
LKKSARYPFPSIFEKKGEECFRKIEEKICCKLIDGKPKILSLGGGAFINSKIRKEIKKNGVSFWISASLENIYDRLLQVKKQKA